MDRKRIFSVAVFVVALLFAVGSAVVGWKSSQLESEIQSSLADLLQTQQEIVTEATRRSEEGELIIRPRPERLGSYFRCAEGSLPSICRGSMQYFFGVVPPQESALRERILEVSTHLSRVSAEREQLERPLGVDKDLVRVVISFAVLFAALFIILSGRFSEASEKWAFGAVGIILGYWLNGQA